MNIKQVIDDMNNGVIVCRQTQLEVAQYALALQQALISSRTKIDAMDAPTYSANQTVQRDYALGFRACRIQSCKILIDAVK